MELKITPSAVPCLTYRLHWHANFNLAYAGASSANIHSIARCLFACGPLWVPADRMNQLGVEL